MVLKSRKSRNSKNLANIERWRSQPLQGSAEPIRSSVVAYALIDVVPQRVKCTSGPENFQSSTKKDFFNTIDPQQTRCRFASTLCSADHYLRVPSSMISTMR